MPDDNRNSVMMVGMAATLETFHLTLIGTETETKAFMAICVETLKRYGT